MAPAGTFLTRALLGVNYERLGIARNSPRTCHVKSAVERHLQVALSHYAVLQQEHKRDPGYLPRKSSPVTAPASSRVLPAALPTVVGQHAAPFGTREVITTGMPLPIAALIATNIGWLTFPQPVPSPTGDTSRNSSIRKHRPRRVFPVKRQILANEDSQLCAACGYGQESDAKACNSGAGSLLLAIISPCRLPLS